MEVKENVNFAKSVTFNLNLQQNLIFQHGWNIKLSYCRIKKIKLFIQEAKIELNVVQRFISVEKTSN